MSLQGYGQRDYNDHMGNGTFTIRQIGCFVTAFSNLLERFGYGNVNPSMLNNYFTSHNVYLADPSDGLGVKDDLAFGSITAYDPSITIQSTGSGSWPNSDNAIVKFIYPENGTTITHFCLVASVAQKTIVDSWDGQTKPPGAYGAPVAWATYAYNFPHAVPVPHPASKPADASPSGNEYILARTVHGYMTANDAKARVSDKGMVPVGTYHVFNQSNGMVNITRSPGIPGWWINPIEEYAVAQVNPPSSAPVTGGPGYVNVTVLHGWGLERVAAAAGRGDAARMSTWAAIAQYNGDTSWSHFNKNLRAGQVVKVPVGGGHGEGIAVVSNGKLRPTFYDRLVMAGGSLEGLFRKHKGVKQ